MLTEQIELYKHLNARSAAAVGSEALILLFGTQLSSCSSDVANSYLRV